MANSTNSLQGEALLNEMKRRSMDQIKVFNPTSEDYFFRFDSYSWMIPGKEHDLGHGKGMNVVPRYIARHYFTHMIDKLITGESDALVAKAKVKYNGSDWPREEERIALRTNNPTLRSKYMKQLFVSKVSDYGMNLPVTKEEQAPPSGKPLDEDLLEELENQTVTDKPEASVNSDFIDQISQ